MKQIYEIPSPPPRQIISEDGTYVANQYRDGRIEVLRNDTNARFLAKLAFITVCGASVAATAGVVAVFIGVLAG